MAPAATEPRLQSPLFVIAIKLQFAVPRRLTRTPNWLMCTARS